jgi:hypothetical protein
VEHPIAGEIAPPPLLSKGYLTYSGYVTWNSDYQAVRSLFQRGLALVYLMAYLVTAEQFKALLGEHGLLPVPLFLKHAEFAQAPSVFFFWSNDTAFGLCAWLGVALSAAALAGITERFGWWVSSGAWALLWAMYLSFVNVGQTFYAFGWESMLLEAGFLAIFLAPKRAEPSAIPMWLLRWMEFRVMLGAGLIKLRGDACWRSLTCLDRFYETQPMPNPLSWYFHWLPAAVHRGGVLFNHFVELIVPFAFFLPQPWSSVAGGFTILFQLALVAGGNLSFLNLLTIVLAIPLIDGRYLRRWFRVRAVATAPQGRVRQYAMAVLALMVGLMSIPVVRNMASSRQMMNASFNPLQLVNTYGMFGSITETRDEVIVEGTNDPPDDRAHWRAYEFKGKPGDPMHVPPQIAPYHLRLDWLMWFAAMGPYQENPWFVNFTSKLLQGDREVLGLLRFNPFPQHPPKYVRAMLYHYRFSTPEEHRRTGAWWQMEPAGPWFPVVSLEMPAYREVLRQMEWM